MYIGRMAYPLTDAEFRYFYSKMPRLCVDVCVIKDGQILLTKRTIDPFLGLWHIPGGTVYFGETIAAAAKRIATEEVGLTVAPGKVLAVLDYPDERKGDWRGWPIAVEVEATIVSGEPKVDQNSNHLGFFTKLPRPMVSTQRRFLLDQLGYEEEVRKK